MARCDVFSLLTLNVYTLHGVIVFAFTREAVTVPLKKALHCRTGDREQGEEMIAIQLQKEDVRLSPLHRSNDRRGYIKLKHNRQAFVGSIHHWKCQCIGIVLLLRRYKQHHAGARKQAKTRSSTSNNNIKHKESGNKFIRTR